MTSSRSIPANCLSRPPSASPPVPLRGLIAALCALPLAAACGPVAHRARPPAIPDAILRRARSAARTDLRSTPHDPVVYQRVYDRVTFQPTPPTAESHSAGWMRHLRVRRYVLLRPDLAGYTTLTIRLSAGEVLNFFAVATISPTGAIRRYGRRDLIREPKPGGGRTVKLIYGDVRKGTVIEERTEVVLPLSPGNLSRARYHRFALQWDVPVQDLWVDYEAPRYWGVRYKGSAPYVRGRMQVRYPRAGMIRYTYRALGVPALHSEPFAPPDLLDAPTLTFQVTRLYFGGAVFRASAGWAELANQVSRVLLQPTPALRQVATRIAKALAPRAAPPGKRLAAVLRWAQDALVTPPPGIIPGDLATVLRSRYGTRKQITAATYHLLRAAGLSVELLLAHDSDLGVFGRTFISLGEVDEPLLWVNVNGVGRLVAPWARCAPPGWVPPSVRGQWALRIGAHGYVGWLKIPVWRHRAPDRVARYQITVQGADLRVRLLETFRGERARRIRTALRDQSPAARARRLSDSLRRHGPGLQVRKIRVVNLTAFAKPLRVQSLLLLRGAVHRMGDRALVTLSTGRLSRPLLSGPRTRRVDVRTSRGFVEEIHLRLPAGWRLDPPPRPESLRLYYGSVVRTVQVKPRRLHIRQSVQLRQSWGPPATWKILDRLLRAADDQSTLTLVFSTAGVARRPQGAAATPPPPAP